MKCFYCKGAMISGTTVYTVQIGENILVIKNVPCEECQQCGEIEISDATMQILEKIVAKVVANEKTRRQEISLVDYIKAA